ncbi:DNA-binding response regulator [uncultured Paenibacillus sp.]|uniref:DNA-binding response regulator n=1 Tax=uncultured Paenibacillus sp. TaxID=227322 RepID=UPI0028D1D8C3|nr:DNA-binding response regulator [uncultured Paenibacillus sp.]
MMYETIVRAWLERQISASAGERRRRLLERHDFAEKLFLKKVWWPAVGHFEHLHAEYEATDFLDGIRFLDFAYLRPPHKIALEIDGFGPHARDADRRTFADGLMRQNHLILDGWKVIRFSLDDVKDKPRQCQQFIQQMLGRWYGGQSGTLDDLPLKEREILRLAAYSPDSIGVSDVCALAGIKDRHARALLKQLCAQGMLLPDKGVQRVHSYRLSPVAAKLFS